VYYIGYCNFDFIISIESKPLGLLIDNRVIIRPILNINNKQCIVSIIIKYVIAYV
jgi:hypothetical protein